MQNIRSIWTCRECGSTERPSGSKPTLCRQCLSDTMKKSKPTYHISCTNCGDPTIVKAKTGKYCTKCRTLKKMESALKNQSQSQNQSQSVQSDKNDLPLIKCTNCNKLRPAGFASAKFCLSCYKQFAELRKAIGMKLKSTYAVVEINGKPSLVQILKQSDTYLDLHTEIVLSHLSSSVFKE